MKKLLVSILLLILCACGSEKQTIKTYIDPIKDIYIFAELDPDSKVAIKKANNNNEYKNKQFAMLNKNIFNYVIEDIKGNSIDVSEYSKIIFDVVSNECEHCKRQIQNIITQDIDEDILFIQYFNKGSKQDILSLYESINIDIPENIHVVESNKKLKDYCQNYLLTETYPTLITFLNGKVSFNTNEELQDDIFNNVLDIGFENPIYDKISKYISMRRDSDDVKNDLSIVNQDKIAELDNDTYTSELTYSIMSSKCDFDIISNNFSEVYVNEIEDFGKYKNSELVLLYSFLKDENDVDKIEYINELIKVNDEVEYIVVLVEGLDSSSSTYKKLNVEYNAPVVSILGYKPDDFFKFGLSAYPTAVFVNRGTFTGAYSNIENKEKFNEAIKLFLGEDCIAYKENN